MDKILVKLIALVVLFFGFLFGANQIDWMGIFKIENNISSTEEKLGELIWEFYLESHDELKEESIISPIDSILSKICTSNEIDQESIQLHIVQNTEVNAFALPNKHLVIYTGLINAVKNEAELSGVIGHEVAHMELDHVMKKMVKEMGLAVLISMTTGNGNSQILIESMRTLTSSAYDRSLEEDADLKAVDYLINANIDPTPFADFLYSLGSSDSKTEEYLSWVSTHPYSKERAEYIITYSQDKDYKVEPILANSTWEQLKQEVK